MKGRTVRRKTRSTRKSATAFGPATVANVAVGFDILGFAIEGVGDEVTVQREARGSAEGAKVVIEKIEGAKGLPLDPARNTATAGLLSLLRERNPGFGFRVSIRKGIPIGSGMGGSAASAVAGVVAASALLDEPLSDEELLRFALEGESVAGGSAHPDNISPCLHGGLTLARTFGDEVDVHALPVPKGVQCVVVHPHLEIRTREARALLRREVPLSDFVRQTGNLAAFVAACYTGDLALLRDSAVDAVIEPQRKVLIPGFERVKASAMAAGALCCSIAGSGPSLFAWTHSRGSAEVVKKAMETAFRGEGMKTDSWISKVNPKGARLVS